MNNTEMKTYKRYSAAKKAANGEPIIRVGNLFLVGVTVADAYGVSIDLLNGKGQITGSITARHLDRIGNGNHAEAKMPYGARIWLEVK